MERQHEQYRQNHHDMPEVFAADSCRCTKGSWHSALSEMCGCRGHASATEHFAGQADEKRPFRVRATGLRWRMFTPRRVGGVVDA
jgi:hypothetical protein